MVHFPVVGLVRPDVKDDVLHGGGTLEVMAFLLYYKLSISYFCLQLRCTLLTKNHIHYTTGASRCSYCSAMHTPVAKWRSQRIFKSKSSFNI